jgi:hypothetical protein
MTFNIVPVLTRSSVSAELVYSTATGSTNNTNVPFGNADLNRKIVAFIGNATDGGTITGATIGGVSGSFLASQGNVLNVGFACFASVPNGSTGTIAIAGTSSSYHLVIYAVYEAAAAHDTAQSAASVVNLNVPDNGVVLSTRFYSGAGTVWSGVDIDNTIINGSVGSMSFAHREFTTGAVGHGISAVGGATPFPVLLAASFGP